MFLKCHCRVKDGKVHRYWNIVENRRCGRDKYVQRQVLYLGEINDTQRESWCRTIEVFDENRERTMPLALFPADRQLPNFAAGFGVQVRLKEMELHRPRQWGACWLACYLYEQLQLDEFWAERLPDSREGTCWQHILQTLVCYRLIDPGSEWRLHRQWFEQSAMAELLDEDYSLVEKNSLYRCLDKVLQHKEQLFGHLRQRWQNLFGARFEVLLYDLTSTYFESPGVKVKVLPQENELYILAQSQDRRNKERAMRRRQLKALWRRLGQLQQMKLNGRNLLLKLGEAKGRYPTGWRLIDIQLPEPTAEGNSTFGFALNRQKLRQVRRREGRYLLRTNLCEREPAELWQFYIQLVEIEAAFKNLKDDLALGPIFHQLEQRIEAHIFVAFIAYCLHVTLRARLRPLAPG